MRRFHRLGAVLVATLTLVAASCSSSPTANDAAKAHRSSAEEKDKGGQSEAEREREERENGETEHPHDIAGAPKGESGDLITRDGEYAQARLAPGRVAPGAYSAAFTSLSSLPVAAGTWSEVTNKPYNSDDPNYRDPSFSNSGGGSGLVTGRVTGLAADGTYVYAGGADGGVFRSADSGTTWTPITDGLPTLSVGDLRLAPDGALWLATGEGNTGATSYVGSGIYRLASPRTGSFAIGNRVGGTELESTMINKIKFDDNGNAYAATSHGLWRHSSTTASGAWTNLLHAPTTPTGTYDDIFNDVAIQPGTAGKTLVTNAAWRGGAAYNGFYLSTNAGATWAKAKLNGAIVAKNVGNAELAYSADGKKLYTVVEDTSLYATGHQAGNSVLMGVFVSNNGTVAGPWTSVADYRKLGNSGSALKTNKIGQGYGPGVQAWYNNFIAVDPANSQHVFLGLEEVFESKNGGSTWQAVGPYWNFGFSCWNISDAKNTCPSTTHSDQHSIAFANGRVYVGNDGGVYSRPINGQVNANGNATDWKSQNGNVRALQYYSVGTGYVDTDGDGDIDATDKAKGVSVFGGLQDNGGSLLLPGATTMVSPFGGDGGDSIVDPANGCNILDEYVYLTLWVTKNCGRTQGDPGSINDVSVPDPNPRFTAPFRADTANKDHWVAGGQHVWTYDGGFGIGSGDDWVDAYDLGDGNQTTGLSSNNDVAWVGWCGGGCNPDGFSRGIATNYGGTWHQVTLPANMPNRYISNMVIDTHDASGKTAYAVFNGFSRRFVEGPGAGIGHLWKTSDGGTTWTDVSGNLPDVPADDLVITPAGSLVLGTDLGVVVSTDGGAHWKRLGSNHPYTTVMDLHQSPDGKVYSATHGRGIWKITQPA
jgi:hypothetical protein